MTKDDTIETYEPRPDSDLALEPCPFCGSPHIVYEKYQHIVGERWRVWCAGCLAGIDPGYAQDRATVQRRWNRRANTKEGNNETRTAV